MSYHVLPVYPPRQYLYKVQVNPNENQLCQVVVKHSSQLAEIRNTPFRKSIEAEKVIIDDMSQLGFMHSVTNRQCEALFRRGLNFEVDFFHQELQIAVEVEKGEINNIWKNLCKFAESSAIRHGVLLVPVVRQGQQSSSEFYHNTIKRLSKIERIYSYIDSLLIIGY